MRKYEIVVLSKGAYARTVRIYSNKHADRAVVFHDGKSVFEGDGGLHAIELVRSVKAKNVAVVAIDCVSTDDYIPFAVENDDAHAGGKTDEYRDFILQTLIPYLDRRFKFDFYAMAGIGLSAAATLYIAASKSERLRAYGLFSTPLFFCPRAFDEFLSGASFDKSALYSVYTGGSERPDGLPEQISQAFVSDSFKTVNALRLSGVKDLTFSLDNLGTYDNSSRLPHIKKFITDFNSL